MNCSQWIKATHQSECSWNSPQIPFAMEIIGNDDRNHCAAAPILWHGRFIGEEIASISSVLCLPFVMKTTSKWSEWSALKKQSQHCTQLLSNSSAHQEVLKFSRFQRYTCRENISEVHRRKLSLWNTKRCCTSDPRYTIQTSECHLLWCQTGNNTKKLGQKWTTWKHNFRNQVWSCERHWLVQTPAFGCSSFNCASRKSASSWASSADKF